MKTAEPQRIAVTDIDDFAPLIIQSRLTGASMLANMLCEEGYINSALAAEKIQRLTDTFNEI